jgi:Flp pilus assembly protein TadG
MSALRSFLTCQRGAVAAEMVLVLPFLVVLLFGAVELGYYFYNEHQVVKGVRDGARYASRQSFTAISCNGTTPSAIPAGIETNIKEVTRTGQISGGTARVPGWVNGDITVSVTCPATAVTTGIYKNETNAPQVNIDTSVDYNSLFGGLGVIDSTFTLNASQQAAAMGI